MGDAQLPANVTGSNPELGQLHYPEPDGVGERPAVHENTAELVHLTEGWLWCQIHTHKHTQRHTHSISTAGCQVLKLTKRSISNEGFSSCHSMGYTSNSVYVQVCVCVCVCVQSVCFQLAPLNLGSSVSAGTCRNKFVFGVWVGLDLCVCVCV